MKRLSILLMIGFAALFVSCNKDSENSAYRDIRKEKVLNLEVSPSSYYLYIDSDLPTLKPVALAVDSIAASLLHWESDHPEIIKVDAKTGKLTWGKPRNAIVNITVTSDLNPQCSATCKIEVSNTAGKYKYIFLGPPINLWMLDRNLGATDVYTHPSDWFSSAATYGNYYQFGNNDPAANLAIVGWEKVNGVRAGLPGFKYWWNFNYQGRQNWEDNENLPIDNMEGWRLPTKEEMEKLAFYSDPDNFHTAKEKKDAMFLRKKLGIPPSGFHTAKMRQDPNGQWGGPKGFGDTFTGFFWTSTIDKDANEAYIVMVDNALDSMTGKLKVVKFTVEGTSLPVRLFRTPEK